MKKLLLALLGVVGLTATLLYAQPVSQNAVSGNECWNAGQGPGGPSQFLCINTVRNGAAILNIVAAGAATTTTGTQNTSTYAWTGTAPATSWTFTFPNPAFDGEIVTLATDTVLTNKVTTAVGSTPQAQVQNAGLSGSTIAVNASVEWQFSFANLTWYKMR